MGGGGQHWWNQLLQMLHAINLRLYLYAQQFYPRFPKYPDQWLSNKLDILSSVLQDIQIFKSFLISLQFYFLVQYLKYHFCWTILLKDLIQIQLGEIIFYLITVVLTFCSFYRKQQQFRGKAAWLQILPVVWSDGTKFRGERSHSGESFT